jgi:hypothetical protein
MNEFHVGLDVNAASSDIVGFECLRRHDFAKVPVEPLLKGNILRRSGAPSQFSRRSARPTTAAPKVRQFIDTLGNRLPPRVLTHPNPTNALPINDERNNDVHGRTRKIVV